MDKQPEALRLAEWLDDDIRAHHEETAAELRRLHHVNRELVDALAQWANAEASDDQVELENARTSRDAALAKNKEKNHG